MQNMGPVHDTDSRELPDAGEVLALGTIDQVETVAAGEGAERASTPAATHTVPARTDARRRRDGEIPKRCGR
jgi:hypothetical protein